jgi:hypothetical protein
MTMPIAPAGRNAIPSAVRTRVTRSATRINRDQTRAHRPRVGAASSSVSNRQNLNDLVAEEREVAGTA